MLKSRYFRSKLSPQVVFLFDGVAYRWSGWFGCQLESIEHRPPSAGTMRRLDFGNGRQAIDVTVFSVRRLGLRAHRVTWSVCKSGSHDEYAARIWELRDALRALV